MKCSTCGTRTDTKKARKAHSISTGHDFYEPTAEAMAAYEAKLAAPAQERTYYVSPLAIFLNQPK